MGEQSSRKWRQTPMSDCVARLRGRAMRTPCAVAFALVATATFAAPLATTTTADAADGSGPVIKVKTRRRVAVAERRPLPGQGPHRVHPGQEVRGDRQGPPCQQGPDRGLQGRARQALLRRPDLDVERQEPQRQGRPDGGYSAVFVADQVAEDGKTAPRPRRGLRRHPFDATWAPEVNADTIYPNTAADPRHGRISLGNVPDNPMTALGRVVMRVTGRAGTRGLEDARLRVPLGPLHGGPAAS